MPCSRLKNLAMAEGAAVAAAYMPALMCPVQTDVPPSTQPYTVSYRCLKL